MSSAPFLYIRVQLLSKYEEIKEKGGKRRVCNECYIFFPPDIWIRRRKYCLRDRLIAHDKNFGYIRNIVHRIDFDRCFFNRFATALKIDSRWKSKSDTLSRCDTFDRNARLPINIDENLYV